MEKEKLEQILTSGDWFLIHNAGSVSMIGQTRGSLVVTFKPDGELGFPSRIGFLPDERYWHFDAGLQQVILSNVQHEFVAAYELPKPKTGWEFYMTKVGEPETGYGTDSRIKPIEDLAVAPNLADVIESPDQVNGGTDLVINAQSTIGDFTQRLDQLAGWDELYLWLLDHPEYGRIAILTGQQNDWDDPFALAPHGHLYVGDTTGMAIVKDGGRERFITAAAPDIIIGERDLFLEFLAQFLIDLYQAAMSQTNHEPPIEAVFNQTLFERFNGRVTGGFDLTRSMAPVTTKPISIDHKANVNAYRLRKYERIANQIIKKQQAYHQLSDRKLQKQTVKLRQRLEQGTKLSAILVDAYATVVEADERVLGKRPYNNQILGGVVLALGNIAEMKTGEGKTLTASMPMYLNGLTGPGNFLVTANGYLAGRDAADIGRVYRWLGLTIEADDQVASPDPYYKKKVYGADITYTTYGALGFDYLLDNLASNPQDKNQGRFHFALIDEVDSVLLDMASTPLIISGAPRVQSNLFVTANRAVQLLEPDEDYERGKDQKQVWLTTNGIKKLENYFGIDSLLSAKWSDLYRHINIALRANLLFEKNRDYLVTGDQVILLDNAGGRKLEGVRLEAGLQQAIEAREGVELTNESRSMAFITYQNLFRLFYQLAGMTGTALTDSAEFMDVYRLQVIVIPSHKPNKRTDHADLLYALADEKMLASLEMIKDAYQSSRPVLVETGSVELSERYSYLLLKNGIVHNLLNAKSEAKEARIIQEAGQVGAVTVATSMAGRGTDIRLGDGVTEMGGLLIIGTERMSSLRVDNQLRGRAGRQGDPGDSYFFVSLEDKVIMDYGSKSIVKRQKKLATEIQKDHRQFGKPLHSLGDKRLVDRVQTTTANQMKDSRKSAVQYDEIQQVQRRLVYQFRDRVMATDDMRKTMQLVIKHNVDQMVSDELAPEKLVDFIVNNVDYDFRAPKNWQALVKNKRKLKSYLNQMITKQIERQKEHLSDNSQLNYLERLAVLKGLDISWIEQVDYLHQLKSTVTNRAKGQRNPLYEYSKEAKAGFDRMKMMFWREAMRNLLLSTLNYQEDGTVNISFP